LTLQALQRARRVGSSPASTDRPMTPSRSVGSWASMPAAAVSWSRAACRAMGKLARSGVVPGQVSTASTMARGTAETLTKGSRVIVQGRLRQRSFETREGEKRTVIGLEVDDVDPSLREVDPSLR